MPKVYEKDGRIGRVTLNRPEVLNAIDGDVPQELADAVARANADQGVHVIVLAGAGRAFCAGYDLAAYAQAAGTNEGVQAMPWDPMKDYAFMMRNTELFMSLWRSYRPVICKVHGFAVAGGSDIALCSDIILMEETAEIGYMPVRVWGCPTTAMWVYRLGPERAKRMLFTGDRIDGREAEKLGLVYRAVPASDLDAQVDALATRIATVPVNQLMMQKMVVNQAVEAMGLLETQRLATIFDGITRHSPEGLNFKARRERRLETGRARARRGHVRLDREPADRAGVGRPLLGHDHFRKPAPTFRDHTLTAPGPPAGGAPRTSDWRRRRTATPGRRWSSPPAPPRPAARRRAGSSRRT
jgi:enoyl-CoA hydratase